MKRLNKKNLINECLEGITTKIADDYTITDKEMRLFRREAKKIITDFVKSYHYDEDYMGDECIDDYSEFQDDLMAKIRRETQFFKEERKEYILQMIERYKEFVKIGEDTLTEQIKDGIPEQIIEQQKKENKFYEAELKRLIKVLEEM